LLRRAGDAWGDSLLAIAAASLVVLIIDLACMILVLAGKSVVDDQQSPKSRGE
jgi:hypothetical protein